MVGREAPLAAAEAALTGAMAGAGGLVLISGEAGIGKTRLAQAIVDLAARHEVPQAWGPAVDDIGAPPLWPWRRGLRTVQAVRALLDSRPDAPPGAADPSARFRMFGDVCDLVVDHAAERGLLLVLEDMHWADDESLALLEHVATELPRSRLLVVVTYRPHEELNPTLGRLIRGSGVTHLSLAGLTAAEIDRWLRQLPDGVISTSLAGELRDRTGGNPLLVRLVTQALLAGPPGRDAAPWEQVLNDRPDVRRLIASRTSTLSRPARQMVDAAAALGESCALPILTEVIGADQWMAQLVAEVTDANVLREIPDGAGSLQFTHALVRDAVYADLTPADAARWHRACAAALENASPPTPAGIIAGHWERAGGTDAVARCLTFAEVAANEAEASYAFGDACRFTELALSCATALRAPDADKAALTIRLAEFQFAAGNIEASLATCTTASDIAARAGRPDLMAAAALVVQGIGNPDVNRRIRALCHRALGALGNEPTAVRARLLALVAAATAEDEGGPLAERLSAEALAAAEQTGDPVATLEAIAARHLAISVPDTVAVRLQLGRRAIELGAAADRPLAALWGHLWRVDAAFQLGNLTEVDREIAEIDRIATDRRSPLARWHWHRLTATRNALVGDFPAATEHNRAATALADGMGEVSLAGMSFSFNVLVALIRGDPAEIPDGLHRMLQQAPRMPLVQVSGPIASALSGDLSAARAAFDSFRDVPATLAYGTRWGATLGQIGLAAILLGDAEVAEAVYGALEPTARYFSGDGSGAIYSHGAMAAVLGELALTADRPDDAVRLLREGVAMNARIGARPAASLARLNLARALLARREGGHGEPGRRDDDLETARTLLADATAEFSRLDMPGPLARALELQGRLAGSAAPVLSRRETEIALLVAKALSNREIAEKLFLSERTVESHVRNILGKLGFSSRTEIAVWAAQRGRLSAGTTAG